jgi:tetratricopeptide (TPR) repeat protein
MSDNKQNIRIVVTDTSYRSANRLRHILILAEYNRDNIFEAVEIDKLFQTLHEASPPMHLLTLTPPIVSALEGQQLHEVFHTKFPDLALLLIRDETEHAKHSRVKIIPDYVLASPFSAESIDNAITTALINHNNRKRVVEHIARGQAAITRDLLKNAQTHFEVAVSLGGPDPYPCYALGDLYASLGDNEKAISFFSQAWEKDPSSFGPMQRIVDMCCCLGNTARAIPYLERASETNIAPVESLVQLGAYYVQNGSPEKASVKFRLASSMDRSRTLAAIQAQIQPFIERGEIDAAITLLQIGLGVIPDHPHLYGPLGDLLMLQNRHKEALFYFEQLTHATHPLPADYCRLARVYLELGFDLRAERAVTAALNLDPECVEAARLRSLVVG